MRILGAAVLTMESFVMGFAILLAMKSHGALALTLGGVLAVAFLLTAGIMKSKTGWYLGTGLQVAMIAYGSVVTAMYAMGGLFAGLWGCAYFFGKKGEAIRAGFLAQQGAPAPDTKPADPDQPENSVG